MRHSVVPDTGPVWGAHCSTGDGEFAWVARMWQHEVSDESSYRNWHIHGFVILRHLARSEEHTSELQSLRHLVCRLLLRKKPNRVRQRGTRAVGARLCGRSLVLARA